MAAESLTALGVRRSLCTRVADRRLNTHRVAWSCLDRGVLGVHCRCVYIFQQDIKGVWRCARFQDSRQIKKLADVIRCNKKGVLVRSHPFQMKRGFTDNRASCVSFSLRKDILQLIHLMETPKLGKNLSNMSFRPNKEVFPMYYYSKSAMETLWDISGLGWRGHVACSLQVKVVHLN